MDFIGGALPNVMFLIGVIAIGIGLGLEFKIIEVKNGLSRGGRIGACVVGIVLVLTSVALYLRPTQTASGPSPVVAAAAAAPTTSTSSSQGVAAAATTAPTSAPTATPAPMATAVPTSVPTIAPTTIPTVEMPDIREMSPKEAEKLLTQLGLQLGEPAASCEELGVAEELWAEARKGRIACQSEQSGTSVPEGSTVTYAVSDGKD